MRCLKLVLTSIYCMAALLLMPAQLFAYEKPNDRFYVNDFADVLSDETEQYIYDNSVKLAFVNMVSAAKTKIMGCSCCLPWRNGSFAWRWATAWRAVCRMQRQAGFRMTT